MIISPMPTTLFKTLFTRQAQSQQGFTLIELLIVVAIIGILSSIAIPAFKQYQIKSFNAVAQTDIRGLRTDMEAYFADNMNYPY